MKMGSNLIVSDTGPIITLCTIDKIDILKSLFSHVYIPKAVYTELNNSKYPREIELINKSDFISIKEVKNNSEVQELVNSNLGLHIGESEAIVLAEEIAENNIPYLVIDDLSARTCAEFRGIRTVGAIGIISQAIKQGLIKNEEIEKCISLMKQAHRFYSETLYNELRKVAEKYSENDKLSLNNDKAFSNQEQEKLKNEVKNKVKNETEIMAFKNLMTPVLKKNRNIKLAKQIYRTMFSNWDDDKINQALAKLSNDLGINLQKNIEFQRKK